MSSLEEILLSDWNVYVAQTFFFHKQVQSGKMIPSRKPTEKNLSVMMTVVAWTAARMVEPRAWIYFLFKVRGWRYPPKFERDLRSEKLLEKYRKAKHGYGFFRKRMAADDSGAQWDPNRDLTESVEHLKHRFVSEGRASECRERSFDSTLGFHPRSRVCASCPERGTCALDLEAGMRFPVIALRSGAITAQQAEKISRG